MKKGRFTKSEQKFIKENHDILSEEEMGLRLDRDPESISKYILDKIKTAPNDAELQASYDLQQRPYWRELKQQFTEEELEMLVYHWGRIISQFRDDVLPTEELQVIDAIKLEILMNRALITHHQTSEEVKDLEIRIQAEKDLGDDGDRDFILNLERQAGVLRAAIETISKDYNNLQAKKSGMLKDSKTTFIGWLRRLMEEPELRYQLGVNMEKMRIATEMERKRLTEYHSYEDDGVDQPFLTPEDAKD